MFLSSTVTGQDYERLVNEICSMGFERDRVCFQYLCLSNTTLTQDAMHTVSLLNVIYSTVEPPLTDTSCRQILRHGPNHIQILHF